MPSRISKSYLSQSDLTIKISCLVRAIERSALPAFHAAPICFRRDRVEETRLSKYFEHIQQMVDLFDDRCDYRYSEHLQAFWEACQDVGLDRGLEGPVCLNESGTAYLSYHRSINVLVERIRELTRSQRYRRREDVRRYEAGKLEEGLNEYVDCLINRYSRTNIIRVNLYYRAEAQARLRIEHVFNDLDRLTAEHERNPIFEHQIGYICRVEQGDDRGYHIHAAYFFNGNEVRGDIYKAQLIGDLWKRLTRGRGYYHSCNHRKEAYGERLGIGLIKRDEYSERRPHVLYAMAYLVKDDQHLLIKPRGSKRVRKGQAKKSFQGD